MLALLLALPALAATPLDQRLPLDADAHVHVEVICGSVEVRGAAVAELHLTGSLDGPPTALTVRGGGGSVHIQVQDEKKACARLFLEVPAGVGVHSSTVSAPVTLRGVRGALEAETVSGDVVIEGPAASVEVLTVSGEITVSGGGSRVELQTVSGDIVATAGRVERAELQSVSGDLSFAAQEVEALEVGSVSGDVQLRARVRRRAEVSAHSGDVVFAMPADQGLTLTTSTFSGVVKAPGVGKTRVIGDGSAQVEVETFSGDVTVELR